MMTTMMLGRRFTITGNYYNDDDDYKTINNECDEGDYDIKAPCEYPTTLHYFRKWDIYIQWRIQVGGKSGHCPPIEVGNGVWPLGGRKSNDSTV